MDTNLSNRVSLLCGELCNILYIKSFNKMKVNTLIDELNALPYKANLFITKNDATTLVTALCLTIKPIDESLATKTSHLINNIITKQNVTYSTDYLFKVLVWHIECLRKCSDLILPDILHNLQCIMQYHPQVSHKFTDDLIGDQGILINLIDTDKLSPQNPLHMYLISLKCLTCMVSISEEKNSDNSQIIPTGIKERISKMIITFLMKGSSKCQDDFIYSKVIIAALRVLCQLYYNDQNVTISLPEIMGICRHYVLFGLITQGNKPEKIMPSQQTLAVSPIQQNLSSRGGKRQKQRKQRNNAIESLKKEIPVSDRSLIKEIDNFENNSAYKPASMSFLDFQKTTSLALTSDSDISDVENSREAKLIALKSRVRQSASNLLLVLIKVKEKKDIFGYWWALFPDSPNPINWSLEQSSKKTLAYCAYIDPIANSRASVLSVILALLTGSRVYLYQAESSKRENISFIPFSVSLGYVIKCMHHVLTNILDSERSHSVIIVALKCCAALVQATPYHKMKEGMISDLVRSTRKFLLHKDVTLQVGALITMGCILSVHPKSDEILKAIEKDTVLLRHNQSHMTISKNKTEECDDFEEGYSDDEMFSFTNNETEIINQPTSDVDLHYLKSWILDICFKNMGWIVKTNELIKCKPSAIPVILESLQVLSAIAFHHLESLLHSHMMLLGDVLSDMLQNEHQDVVVHSARTVSIIGDAIKKLEQTNQAPPLNSCVYMWQKLVTSLSAVLQCHDNSPAKAAVCDSIANIGERSFKELPRRMQVLCCTLLVGSCSDEEAMVRAAAVRALAMVVIYRTLREDIYFVTDCGENIIRALSEQTLTVRTKAAWALANLSDALVLNLEEPDIDDIDDNLLVRLLEVNIQCAVDNDKIKMCATRGLGKFLRLIKNENLLRNQQIKNLCETAISKLLDCACKVTNMKVRWNACYALSNAMKNDQLFTYFSECQGQVFSSLCGLTQDCKNLKVRINAAIALRAPCTRAQYGDHYAFVWRGILAAMENAAEVDDFTEYKHKDNLIEQLCVTLAHLCCLLTQSDLDDINDPLVFNYECAKSLFVQVCHRLPPENESCLHILQAAKYVTVDLTASNGAQSHSLNILQDIFIWDM